MSADLKTLRHTGKIVGINGSQVDVLMEPRSACAGCKAKAVCGMDENNGSVISVEDIHADDYSVNEEVIVSIKQTLGIKAVFYVYVLPFLLVMITLIALIQSGISELFSGLMSLAVLAVYYFVLYLLRRKIEKEINFTIEKSDNKIVL